MTQKSKLGRVSQAVHSLQLLSPSATINQMGYREKKHTKGGGRGGNSNGNRRQRGRGATSSAIIAVVDAATDLPIRPLAINEETRWKPRSRLTTNIDEADSRSSETHDARLVLLLLNKLTPQNFNKLVPTFLSQCTIHKSNERMKDTITAIIDRASLDVRYAPTYAHLCKKLASDLSKGTDEEAHTTHVSFRDVLLSYCREHVNPPVNGPLDNPQEDIFEHPEERNVRLALARHCYVGSQRFIGELYNSDAFQLTETLLFVEMLLNKVESTDTQDEDRKEMALEGLCVLLDACGKRLDENAVEEASEMQRCWALLKGMVCKDESEPRTKLTFRMKCMILDLLELRESRWNPKRYSAWQRREEMVAKPLECHRQADLQRENANTRRSSRRGERRKEKTVRFKQPSKK